MKILRKILAAVAAMLVALPLSISAAAADVLAEYLFWNTMGDQVGTAARSYADYQSERQMWRNNIAAAQAKLDACGGCDSARAELEEWQGVESQFQDVAGTLARVSGMPPQLASALGIDMPMVGSLTYRGEPGFDREGWLATATPQCKPAGVDFFRCVDASDAEFGGSFSIGVDNPMPGHPCYETGRLFAACSAGDMETFEAESRVQTLQREGRMVPEVIHTAFENMVYFGQVPDDFVPDLPPEDVVFAHFAENYGGPQHLTFQMKKATDSLLVRAGIFIFHWSDVASGSSCFDGVNDEDTTAKAICDDLSTLSFDVRPLVLACTYGHYGVSDVSLYNATLNWYGAVPDLADPARLAAISPEHPLLQIGAPQTQCPLYKGGFAGSGGGYVLVQPGPDLAPGTAVMTVSGGPDLSGVIQSLGLGESWGGNIALAEVYTTVMLGNAVLMTKDQAEQIGPNGHLDEVGQLVEIKTDQP